MRHLPSPFLARTAGNTAAATTRPPLLLSFKRGKYKLKLPLQDGRVVSSAVRDTAFSFHPNHSLETVKANIQVRGSSVLGGIICCCDVAVVGEHKRAPVPCASLVAIKAPRGKGGG